MPNENRLRTKFRRLAKLLVPLGWLFFMPPAHSQVIENPAHPPAKNAGRVLRLKEIWRITDEEGKYFFKWPRDFQIVDDGTIFIADEEQLLKFSAEGKYLKNIYKKGQGPGEIGSDFTFKVQGYKVYVWDAASQRLFWTDCDGRFIRQIGFAEKTHNTFLGAWAEGFLFIDHVPPPESEQNEKLVDFSLALNLVSPDGVKIKELHRFKTRIFLTPASRTSWDGWFIAFAPDSGRIYASCRREYLVEVFDCLKGYLIASLKREYSSLPYKERGWENSFYRKYAIPRIRIERDIGNIFVAGKNIWIQTSTQDASKGSLLDVFDAEGRYVDCFYLGLGKSLLAASGDFLFSLEKNPDETYRIIKYKIEG